MQKKNLNKSISYILVAIMIISAVSGIAFAFPTDLRSDYEIKQAHEITLKREPKNVKNCLDTEEVPEYSDDEKVIAIVVFEDKPLMEKTGAVCVNADGARILTERGHALKSEVVDSQNRKIASAVLAYGGTESAKVLYNYSLVFNGAAVEIPYGMIQTLKNTEGVETAFVSPDFEVPEQEADKMNPAMVSAGDMVGAFSAWESGYDGAGTLIAIIDTGLCTEHDAFQTAPTKLKYDLGAMESIFASNDLQAEKLMEGLTAQGTYLRDKIPFAFDYANRDCDVNHGNTETSSDHGTHVAGIAAGNPTEKIQLEGIDDTFVRGVAPQAQLAIMKAAGDAGALQLAHVLAAMEDSVYLGADSVNMSLATGVGPAEAETQKAFDDLFALMHDNGVNVSASCGNYYNSANTGTWATGTGTTWNLENSMLTSPGICDDALAVASVENTTTYLADYISVGDYKMDYYDSAVSVGKREDLLFNKVFGGKTVEYVLVNGSGFPFDFESVDVAGRIAVVQRGRISFEEKHINAYNAGAAGLIIYDNEVQPSMIELAISEFKLPNVYVRRISGLELVKNADENGVGTLYVSAGSPCMTGTGVGYAPSDFSSWGPYCDLSIKPEIAAPGGSIISSVDFNISGQGMAHYAIMEGTSMASPGVAAAMAIAKQRVNELFPDMSPQEKTDLVYALVMSTAIPSESEGTPYGVRRQGAGVVNVKDAISTNAYITVDGQNHPKIELGDDPERSGVYTLKFNVTNFGDTTLSYDISPVLTVPGYSYVDQGTRAAYVQTFENKNCSDMMTFTTNVQDNRLTLEAGKTAAVEVTMTVNDDFRAMMSEVFKYGAYVEGYCYLNPVAVAETAVVPRLSVCYLGYYGSWCEPPVVDSGFYYEDLEERFNTTDYPNTAGSKMDTISYMELGVNPYFGISSESPFIADHCSISPANDDNMYDAVDYFLTGIMRNLSKLYYQVYSPETNEVYYEKTVEGYISKDHDALYTGVLNPTGISLNRMKAWKGVDQQEDKHL